MSKLDFSYLSELVEQAQDGDSNAFAEIYAATYQNQYRFSNSYLRDVYLAQDAVQETYILALRNLNKVRDPSLFLAWLNQINFRVCYQMQKRLARVTPVSDEQLEFQPDAPAADPEYEVIRIDSSEYIIKQVMNLPFTESQAILLRYYRNLKIDEIAELMDVSRSTVKRAIASGCKRLKHSLDL